MAPMSQDQQMQMEAANAAVAMAQQAAGAAGIQLQLPPEVAAQLRQAQMQAQMQGQMQGQYLPSVAQPSHGVGLLHGAYMIAGGIALAAWVVHFWKKYEIRSASKGGE